MPVSPLSAAVYRPPRSRAASACSPPAKPRASPIGISCGIAHGLVTGDKVYLDTGPGPLPSGLYTVTGSTAYTFTVVAPVGSVAVYGYLTVYPHGISKTEMNNNSVNNLNGRSLFNNYYIPGWVYDYGRTSVDTIGTPAI